MLSVVGERRCNLQCAHCIFQKETSTRHQSSSTKIDVAVRNIIRQMGTQPNVVHEGRIFQPDHLLWLSRVRAERPDALIGMIDNGSYLNHADYLRSSGFKFDWLDISVDGTEKVHNQQRNSTDSFRAAIRGIREATNFLSPGGRVTSLFTLTTLNYLSVLETCRLLPKQIQEWHITTLSPARPEIASLSVSTEELREAWHQVKAAAHLKSVFFRIYFADDFLKLAEVVGQKKILGSAGRAKVDPAAMQLEVDGVTVIYYPQSVCTNETFVLDTDCFYRAPYSIAYTLQELHDGVSRFGEDISKYTLARVDATSNFGQLYKAGVQIWKKHFGLRALVKEVSVFDRISQ